MTNKTINVLTDFALPFITIVLTIVLFFIFRPKVMTGLFWINMGYCILLEVVFFGYIISLRRNIESFSAPLKAVFGVFALYYIVVGLICMLLYSLLLVHFMSLKFYISALIIITLLWIIGSLLTLQAGSNYEATQEKNAEKRKLLNFHIEKIKMLANRYANLYEEKQLIYDKASNQRTALDKLATKINGLTPGVFKNETATIQINTIISKCELLLDEAEMTTEEQMPEIEKKIQRFVETSIIEINMLQSFSKI